MSRGLGARWDAVLLFQQWHVTMGKGQNWMSTSRRRSGSHRQQREAGISRTPPQAHAARRLLFLHHLKMIPHKENIVFFPVQSFLQRNLGEKMNSNEELYWIGLTDAQTEGTWLWADGSPLSTRFECWETPFCFFCFQNQSEQLYQTGSFCSLFSQFDVLELQGARWLERGKSWWGRLREDGKERRIGHK